jgi:hypothetical protein
MDVREKAKEVVEKNNYLNCRLFVQLVTGIDNIENQKRIEEIVPYSILWWGNESYLHVAIALDKEKILQVPEWGGDMEEISYNEVIDYWGNPDRIYSTEKV